MSAFNPNHHKLSAADWQSIARETNSEVGSQFKIIGGVVLGLFAAASASPITGLLVAGYFGYQAWKDTQAANRNDEAIDSYGCVAHLLKEADLKTYTRQIGAEKALEEITFAIENGYRVSSAALDFIEDQGVDVETITSRPALAAAKSDEATIEQAAIVASEPTDHAPGQPSPVPYLIGDRLRTSLIVSVSGGGKDILLSNALRAFLPAHAGFKVVVADCKDDPKEYGYYDDLPNVSVHRLNVAISSDGEVVEWVDRWVEEFLHLPERALLICNEGTLIRAKSKRYVQAIDGLVSSGDSRQKYCWEAGQSAHTDDLQINGAARSRFRLLIIGLQGEEMQVEAVLAAKFVADTARNMNDIKTMMIRSPVDRAWSDGQRWFAMPRLENYSNYNRDSRSFVADTRAKLENLYQGKSLPAPSDSPSTFPEGAEAGKSPSENLEGAGSTGEVGFPGSEDWRKSFPEAPVEVEEVVFRAYSAALEAGKRKQDFIAEFLRGGSGGRRYQAASKYLDYLVDRFGQQGNAADRN